MRNRIAVRLPKHTASKSAGVPRGRIVRDQFGRLRLGLFVFTQPTGD